MKNYTVNIPYRLGNNDLAIILLQLIVKISHELNKYFTF